MLLNSAQHIMPARINTGTYQNAAFWSHISATMSFFLNICGAPTNAPRAGKVIIQGVMNCVRLTPKLPMPACIPIVVPWSRLGKKRLDDGMKDEKSPPPMPHRNAIIIKPVKEVSGFITAYPSHTIGMSFKKVATVIVLLVPKMGMRKEWINRNVPPASPGMAAIQKSCIVVNLKPMAGSRITTALITNHVAKESISENVVMESVRHASPLPSSFQNCGFSGSHFSNHVFKISPPFPPGIRAYKN